ncbi:hypothetical protein KFE98_13375 [bacterium SCSIO 12741]|nr:hypothetical protein KFE98_13375 [bacterium SCSIO 12741]
MKKVKRILLLVLLVVLSISIYVVFFYNYSEGYRVGTVIKMSKRGMIFKTIEGQLHTGGITSGQEGDPASSIWDFSVHKSDTAVIGKIESAVDNGKPVKLYYREKLYQWAFFGDTKYFIEKVEPIEASH